MMIWWVDVLFASIARQEGAYATDPKTPPRALNNPLDLRYAGQMGASRPKGKMPVRGVEPIAEFSSLQLGIAAGYRQMWLNIAHGMTLRQFIHSWAPPNENDTATYLRNVAKWTNIADVDAPLVSLLAMPPKPG